MDSMINHRFVESTNGAGIKMHIAEKGSGPLVLLIHGFPELWYSWRNQIVALAEKGYHAVAPDLRGYGDTDVPQGVENYTCFHIVGDLIALLDALGEDKVFVVGHDWGAIIAWYFCLFRPDRVKALVSLSVQFIPRTPGMKPIDRMRAAFGDSYYICHFQEPGAAEAALARVDVETTIKNILCTRKQGPPIVHSGKTVGHSPTPITLPDWLSEEDVSYYAEKFRRNGFTGPLNYYRNFDRNWELMAPWTGAKVMVPTKFIVGDIDMTYTTPGTKEYIHNGAFQQDVPLLQEVVVIQDAGHFIMQERASEISNHILDFIKEF